VASTQRNVAPEAGEGAPGRELERAHGGEGGGPRSRATMFSSLRYRDYRFLWVANLCATFAMQMSQVGRGWLVYAMTGSAVKLAWVMVAFMAPTVVFSLLGGVLADRAPKKAIMAISQSVNCASTIALATIIITDYVAFWHFIAFGLLNGTVLSLSMPARQSMIPFIVDQRDIFNAMALSSASMNLSRVLGPSVAGAVIALVAGGDTGSTLGVGIVFYVIAGLYGVSALSNLMLDNAGLPKSEAATSVAREVGDGLAYIWRHPVLRSLFGATFLTMMFGMPVQFLMPAFNQDALAGGPDGLGLLMGAMGVGAITGSLILARMGEVRRKGVWLLGMAFAWGVATWVFAGAGRMTHALPLVAVVGLFSSTFMAMNMSLIQLTVDDVMRGRVMSVMMMTFGLMPIGVVPISFLAEVSSIGVALAVCGLVLCGVTAAMAMFAGALRGIDTGYEDAPAGSAHDGVPEVER